jgi:predicted neutral ceramidase superfamily lipid hydrolase
MEDIPLSAGAEIVRKCKQLGAKEVAIIDAHNSIGSAKEVPALSEEETRELVSAAEEALKGALEEERQPFLVGVAKVIPDEFTIGKGMGSGGITGIWYSLP